MFTLNASLAAFAAVVAFLMIKHKELIRDDDVARKAEARKQETMEMEKRKSKLAPDGIGREFGTGQEHISKEESTPIRRAIQANVC